MKAKTVLVPEYIFNGSQFGILIREFMSIDFFLESVSSGTKRNCSPCHFCQNSWPLSKRDWLLINLF